MGFDKYLYLLSFELVLKGLSLIFQTVTFFFQCSTHVLGQMWARYVPRTALFQAMFACFTASARPGGRQACFRRFTGVGRGYILYIYIVNSLYDRDKFFLWNILG